MLTKSHSFSFGIIWLHLASLKHSKTAHKPKKISYMKNMQWKRGMNKNIPSKNMLHNNAPKNIYHVKIVLRKQKSQYQIKWPCTFPIFICQLRIVKILCIYKHLSLLLRRNKPLMHKKNPK